MGGVSLSHNVDAERFVLGAMMRDPSVIPPVIERLDRADFYNARNADVFAVIVKLHEAEKPTEPVAVATEMDVSDLVRVGGAATLLEMVQAADRPGTIGYYVGILADCAQRRRKWAAASRLVSLYKADDLNPAAEAEAIAELNELATEAQTPDLFTPGGSFVLDVPDVAPAVWGDGKDVIWAQGESLMICGPSGVGKTTLALQVLRARLGLQDKVLGYSVAQTGGRILYLVMDRPAQFRRAAARLFTEDDRELLDERLVVWKGPPPKDIAAYPEILSTLSDKANADTVVVDSLKDAAVGIAKDEVGAGYNRARQQAIRDGFEVAETHHMRKSSADNKEPNTLDDIYGSTWLTAGAGSVVLLWGEPGDPVVKWRHLKTPENEVGPFRVVHDHDAGVSEVEAAVDLVAMIARSGVQGVTALEYAVALFGVAKPSPAQREKARRQLERKANGGQLSRFDGGSGGPVRYFLRVAQQPPWG